MTTSAGCFAMYTMPSSRYSAPTGSSRSPSGPVRLTTPSRAMAIGAVSLDDTAQQRGLLGATRQMSPSFFMQNPAAFRHS